MNTFYMFLVFLVIMMVVAVFISIFKSKKKLDRGIELINQKKEELSSIIEDADQMIQELNKFSDYIFTKVDNRYKMLDEKFDKVYSELQKYAAYNENKLSKNPGNSDLIDFGSKSTGEGENKQRRSKNKRVIQLNTRYREVMNLHSEGLSETQIARKLDMGKGEVKLIMEMIK